MGDFVFKCPKKGEKQCLCIENMLLNLNKENLILKDDPLNFLQKLHNEAVSLHNVRSIDLYSNDSNLKNKRNIGCGRKKSITFIKFVVKNRQLLRSLGLCESATKHILLYSNNLIHRKLKFDEEKRNATTKNIRTKGLVGLGQLESLETISNMKCCKNFCTKLIERLPKVVSSWREQSIELNQINRHKILSEMLLPSANGARNCNKFIRLITGCCRGTINKVYTEMKSNYDGLCNKKHGLVEFQKNNQNKAMSHTQKNFKNIAKSKFDTCVIDKTDQILRKPRRDAVTIERLENDYFIPVCNEMSLSTEINHRLSIQNSSTLNVINTSYSSSNNCNLYTPIISNGISYSIPPSNINPVQSLASEYKHTPFLSASNYDTNICSISPGIYNNPIVSNNLPSNIAYSLSDSIQPSSIFSNFNDFIIPSTNSTNNTFAPAQLCNQNMLQQMNATFNEAHFPISSNIVDSNLNLYISNQNYHQLDYNLSNILPTSVLCQQNPYAPQSHPVLFIPFSQ